MLKEVRLMLRDPTSQDANGNMTVHTEWLEWRPTPLVLDGTCDHAETLCHDCVEEWASDYTIHTDDLDALRSIIGPD